jgi:hypothetical protein
MTGEFISTLGTRGQVTLEELRAAAEQVIADDVMERMGS